MGPREHVLDGGRGQTNPFDKSTMQSLVKLMITSAWRYEDKYN